jgi:hypothetical protein
MNRFTGHQGLHLLFLLVLTVAGCLPAASTDSSSLLKRDYHSMTNSDLVAYEQQLNDELVKASRADNGDVNVGIGFGSWGGNLGYGVTAGRWLGDHGNNSSARELQDRRDAVRTEMKRRGMLPE